MLREGSMVSLIAAKAEFARGRAAEWQALLAEAGAEEDAVRRCGWPSRSGKGRLSG